MKSEMSSTKIALFRNKEIRKTIHNNEWWFVIEDVVAALTDSLQPKGYLKDMRRRDPELFKGWGQIATPLLVDTPGGPQKLNCANTEGIFRIIQSIPSPKAEPFKRWLARVGYERIQEIEAPELAQKRTRLPSKIAKLVEKNQDDFSKINQANKRIRNRLSVRAYSDGKNLKGDELVGWLGEVYGKLFWEWAKEKKGRLVGEDFEHDPVSGKARISIKTRKGFEKGWQQTSPIPRKSKNNHPTHLMFVHLDDHYKPLEVWLYNWDKIAGRLKKHKVRGHDRGYIFRVSPTQDMEHMIWPRVE